MSLSIHEQIEVELIKFRETPWADPRKTADHILEIVKGETKKEEDKDHE